ncbi:MAG: tetratricopeptide repeat protein [Bacteroidota bacterium]|jgi:tetratricopeptide (TPR) repeat protein
MFKLPPLIKILLDKLHIDLSNWIFFNRINSPIDKRTINTHITLNVNVSSAEEIPMVIKNPQSFEQLKKAIYPQITGSSDSVISEDEKKQINSRIDEAVVLMNLNRLDDARSSLLTTLGEIKNNTRYTKEQVRIYNNMGVIYNRPKPDGDFDEAIKYFNEALSRDPNFYKAKMNLASAYINKSDEESISKGFDVIKALWEIEKKQEVLQVLLWGIYKKEKRPEKVIEYFETNKDVLDQYISKNDSILNMMASFYLELGRLEEAIIYVNKAFALSPEEAAIIITKAKTLILRAQQNYTIPSEFDIIPKFSDYKDVKDAEILFKDALEKAENHKLDYLLPEIRYGLSVCSIWLGKFNEAKHSLKLIRQQDLSESLAHEINVLNFATYIHEREFEIAYSVLINSENYSKTNYQERFRIARVFLYNGAPEQAKLIYDSLEIEAERSKDITYWLDLSIAFILLDQQQEAIRTATKVKALAEGKNEKIKKAALSHYNAIMYHYCRRKGGQDSETSRLVEGMFDLQKIFPGEKIITPIKAIDEEGKPTEEIKDMLAEMKQSYESIRDTFNSNPIPTYFLEKTFHRSYSDLMVNRDDPNFIIQFTDVNEIFINELKRHFDNADGYIFDYLSLLDLAKMGFLGFLEQIGKPIYVHKLLFQKIQEELLQNEFEELRKLWNFLRRNKTIVFIEETSKIKLKSERIDDIFDKWLVESIKFAKTNNLSICTNDLRLYQFLKFEDINPINITILLKHWQENKILDKKMYSRSLGDLAERFYVFLPFNGEDLFEIVLEDGGKIALRSYHLVREVFLSGSDLQSFVIVYAKFIDLFWRTGSLPQEKVNWINFLTNIIIELIDRDYKSLKESNFVKQEDLDIALNGLIQKYKPAIEGFAFMWETAISTGSNDDLRELLKITEDGLKNDYLREPMKTLIQQIQNKLNGR